MSSITSLPHAPIDGHHPVFKDMRVFPELGIKLKSEHCGIRIVRVYPYRCSPNNPGYPYRYPINSGYDWSHVPLYQQDETSIRFASEELLKVTSCGDLIFQDHPIYYSAAPKLSINPLREFGLDPSWNDGYWTPVEAFIEYVKITFKNVPKKGDNMSISSQFCNPATGLATPYCVEMVNAYGLPIDRLSDVPSEHILNISANAQKKCYDHDFKVIANKLNPTLYYPDFAHARNFLNLVYSHRVDVQPPAAIKDAVGLCCGGSMHSVVKRLESLKMSFSLGCTIKRLQFIVRTKANEDEIRVTVK